MSLKRREENESQRRSSPTTRDPLAVNVETYSARIPLPRLSSDARARVRNRERRIHLGIEEYERISGGHRVGNPALDQGQDSMLNACKTMVSSPIFV